MYLIAIGSAPRLQLSGGTNALNGRVDILYDDNTYTVCGDIYWSDADADTVCRTLGHTGGRKVTVSIIGCCNFNLNSMRG